MPDRVQTFKRPPPTLEKRNFHGGLAPGKNFQVVESDRILISKLGSVFYTFRPGSCPASYGKAAALRDGGFRRRMKGEDQRIVIKTWKVQSGEFTWMYFIGKECK